VFVEKPMAGSAADAQMLAEVASGNDLILMPGHTFLYSPPVVLVKEMIDRGDLGEIYFISSSRVNLGLHQADVSVVWDLGPHDFSILRYWLGESPESVSALSRACVIPRTPDVAFVSMRYASGTIAQIELAWLAPSKLRRTAVVGSERMVVYDDTSGEPVRIFDSGATLPDPASFGEYQLSYRTGDIVSPRVEPVEPIYRQMEDFCRAVRERVEPRSSARLGLEVVETIEAVEMSLMRSGAPTETAALPASRT
jgi:predicted dehydrogenase